MAHTPRHRQRRGSRRRDPPRPRQRRTSPRPETGENAWTSAYNAIENAINTITAPDDNTPDDPLTAGRNKTRGLLGLPPLPSAATTIASADETDTPTTIALPEGVESTELSNLLAAHADDIVSATDRFIESLTHSDNGKEHV